MADMEHIHAANVPLFPIRFNPMVDPADNPLVASGKNFLGVERGLRGRTEELFPEGPHR